MALDVRYGEIRSEVIAKLETQKGEMENLLDKLSNTVETLPSVMEGQALQAYMDEYEKIVKTIYSKLNVNLGDFSQQLESVCQQFENLDDDTYGGSTIYSAVKVDILNRVYSVEHGVTVESPAVSYNGADVKDSVTMAFGVEVTAPPDWKEQEEIQDVNGYETYEKVVVVAGVAYVIYRVGRVVVATCVGGPVLGGVAAVAP